MSDTQKIIEAAVKAGFTGQKFDDFIAEQNKILKQKQAEDREEREKERELERQKLIAQEKEREERAKQRESDEKDRELQRQKLEANEKQREADAKKSEADREIEMEKMRLEAKRIQIEEEKLQAKIKLDEETVASKGKSKMSPFKETTTKFDAYINRFENYAEHRKWKKDEWALQLSLLLEGKALDVFYGLTSEQQKNYDTVKEALLRHYEYTEEGFRKQFYTTKVEDGETPEQYYARIERLFTKWIEMAKIEKSFDSLCNLVIREQFLRRTHAELTAYLREKKITEKNEFVKAAQRYIDAHGGSITDKVKQNKKPEEKKSEPEANGKKKKSGKNGSHSSKKCGHCSKLGHTEEKCWFKHGKPGENKSKSQPNSNSSSPKACYVCHKTDHLSFQCPEKPSVASAAVECEQTQSVKSTCACIETHSGSACINEVIGDFPTVTETPETLNFKGTEELVHTDVCNKPVHMCSCQNLEVTHGKVNGNNVQVMRDSGCTTIVVKSTFVRSDQYTGEYRICKLIDGTVRRFPLAWIHVQCEYISGEVEAMVMVSPVCDLIVGNVMRLKMKNGEPENYNLLKMSVTVNVPNQQGSSTQEVDQENIDDKNTHMTTHPGSKENSNQSHTRTHTGAEHQDEDDKTDDNCHAEDTNTHISENLGAVQTRSQRAAEKKPMTPLAAPNPETVQKDELMRNQKDDASLKKFWKLAKTKKIKHTKSGTIHYEVKKDVLHRYYTPYDGGKTVKQLMVPKEQRKKVMSLAHDGLMSGHNGVKRTLDRVLSNFYWPCVSQEVTRYCHSCDVCQKTVKKGQGKAPLGKMPRIDIPFKRVAIDIIGPITPASERKHKYILTIVDYATRYPEAVPLKNIDVVTIAEALVEVFSRMGVPEEILSDRGSQFTSSLMKEVCRLLSLRQLFTTPYHPMANGLVERFNATLKIILKRLCSEHPREWDRYLPAVLFAYRSAVQESTGFSPFELVYGRKINGPMEILRKYWSSEETQDETKEVYKYVIDLKTQLTETCRLAQQELEKSQNRQKLQYDKHAKPKSLKVGSNVLLLLPVKKNKLLLQWKGPYKVTEKMSPVNYRIQIGKKIKNFHVNMLKPYLERTNDETDVASSIIITDVNETKDSEMLKVCPLKQQETWRDVKLSDQLTCEQKQEVRALLQEFDDVLTDLPGCTDLVKHEIHTTTDDVIRVKPYPLAYSTRGIVKDEVISMSNMGIVRKSNSPYAAPPVIVNKPDGTKRFCVGYMKLNSVTVFDGEPMPNAEDIYIKMRGKKYRSKFDLTKGFWQIQMHEDSIAKTAFTTPDGVFEFIRMPFGLKNSTATFNRLMRIVLEGMEENTGCFVDDVLAGDDLWKEHLETIREFFTRLRKSGLHARPSKCLIGFTDVDFVGHEFGESTIKPRSEKVSEILQVPRPVTKKQIRSFLGMVGYFSQFIPLFSVIAKPLTDLTKKGCPNVVVWKEEHDKAFQELKCKISDKPVLTIVDLSKTMYVQTDASGFGLGAVLLQDVDGLLHPVKYLSRKLKPCELNYSTIEKECLGIVWAIGKLRIYLYGREFVILTDHHPLTCLNHSGIKNSRLMRWSMFLQDWSFRIEAIRGSDNVIADYLSRA